MKMVEINLNVDNREIADGFIDDLSETIEKTAADVVEVAGVTNDLVKRSIVESYKRIAEKAIDATAVALVPVITAQVFKVLAGESND